MTAIPKPANTAITRLRTGLPNWLLQLKTWAVTTAERPMVNPTDKSIPPEMMTKVWPRPSKSGVTVKTAMDLTLNGLNKNVLLYARCAQISNVIKRIPRKSHARNVAKKSSHRFCLVASGTASVVVAKMEEKEKAWTKRDLAALCKPPPDSLYRVSD